ncbi:MAG TPA: hypothetical protein VHD60_04035 [Candidatus Saccharimonadales bacterium]|nr:hypothetical protein [Candidatus Saccharimonadales bacterium]
MGVSKSTKIVLTIVGLILVALGGVSIWHYSQAAPPLNSKQATATDDFSNLAIHVGSTTTPAANTLHPVSRANNAAGNTTAPATTAANPQTAAVVNPAPATSPQTDKPTIGAASEPTQTQPVHTLTDDLQGTVSGVVDGVSSALGL